MGHRVWLASGEEKRRAQRRRGAGLRAHSGSPEEKTNRILGFEERECKRDEVGAARQQWHVEDDGVRYARGVRLARICGGGQKHNSEMQLRLALDDTQETCARCSVEVRQTEGFVVTQPPCHDDTPLLAQMRRPHSQAGRERNGNPKQDVTQWSRISQ